MDRREGLIRPANTGTAYLPTRPAALEGGGGQLPSQEAPAVVQVAAKSGGISGTASAHFDKPASPVYHGALEPNLRPKAAAMTDASGTGVASFLGPFRPDASERAEERLARALDPSRLCAKRFTWPWHGRTASGRLDGAALATEY